MGLFFSIRRTAEGDRLAGQFASSSFKDYNFSSSLLFYRFYRLPSHKLYRFCLYTIRRPSAGDFRLPMADHQKATRHYNRSPAANRAATIPRQSVLCNRSTSATMMKHSVRIYNNPLSLDFDSSLNPRQRQ